MSQAMSPKELEERSVAAQKTAYALDAMVTEQVGRGVRSRNPNGSGWIWQNQDTGQVSDKPLPVCQSGINATRMLMQTTKHKVGGYTVWGLVGWVHDGADIYTATLSRKGLNGSQEDHEATHQDCGVAVAACIAKALAVDMQTFARDLLEDAPKIVLN